MYMFYICKITNTRNSKLYIGKTCDLRKRWYQHVYDSKSSPTYFGRAICKYGEDAFDIEEIDSHENEDVAYALEKHWIEKLDSTNPDIGYNLAKGGRGGFCGTVPSEETRKKISDLHKNRPRKPMSESTKAKIKEARDKQDRQLLDIDLKNEILSMYRTNNYTKQQVADRFNIKLSTVKSVIRQGVGLDRFEPYKMPEERKRKLSEVNKGKVVIDETREKLRNNSKFREYKPLSDETKNKISKSLNKYYAVPEALKVKIINDYNDLLTRKDIAKRNDVSIDCVDKITSGLIRESPLKDRVLTQEHKDNISKSNMGRVVNSKSRDKISKANSGVSNGMYGRTHSAEAKRKMSEKQKSRKRKPVSNDQKQKLSNMFKGKPRPDRIPDSLKQDVIDDYSTGLFTKKQLSEKYEIKYNSIVNILRKV